MSVVEFTPASERDFGTVFAKLAMQLRWTDADGVTIRAYFDALKDVPLEAVRMAADAFAREAGRKFPPTSAEWHTAALDAQREASRKQLALPAGRTEPWRHECASCEDTGWVQGLECDGGATAWPEMIPPAPRGTARAQGNRQPVGWTAQPRATEKPQAATCGREKPHLPHSYTKVCGCRATNRTWQRHQRVGYAT